MIKLIPYGGLGNRIRSIDSAVALSQCTKKKLVIIWDSNEELNCPFSQLFEVPDMFSLREISTSYLPRKINEKLALFFKKFNINYPFSFDKVLHEKDIKYLRTKNYEFCELKRFRNILIWINGRFLTPEKPYNYLKPVKTIQDRIDKLTAEFENKTIGVHIRRTDNQIAIQNSPLEKFVEVMQSEKKEGEKVRFYLSTDSPEAEKYILDKFGSDVITYKKELSRNKEEGIKDALIDLLCLSKTSKIIGSYYSSFSEVASEIGNIPLVIASEKMGKNA